MYLVTIGNKEQLVPYYYYKYTYPYNKFKLVFKFLKKAFKFLKKVFKYYQQISLYKGAGKSHIYSLHYKS